ncbi:MAG: TrkA-N domain protein [Thermoanaerobacterales bacterium 50_218]|nr:MAG: TrkA-N domain protein [Thermoanaerobacterales bacterium 50_218]HAA90351.1 potassium transporter TrkA [Peptococcaceae bacterium]
MHVIIIGCGSLGSLLAKTLSEEGHDVVVIDRERTSLESLGSGFNGTTLVGIGIDIDVLKKAGIENTDALAAVTTDDNTNIMAAQVARELFQVPKVIARIYDPEREQIYHDFGLETVSPIKIAASQVRYALESRKFRHRFSPNEDLELVEFEVPPGLQGKKISQLQIEGRFRIAGVVRHGEGIIPGDDFVLQAGDTVLCLVEKGSIRKVQAKLHL